jgi:hypothetical protein
VVDPFVTMLEEHGVGWLRQPKLDRAARRREQTRV